MITYFLHDGIKLYSYKEFAEHKATCPICQKFWKPLETSFAERLQKAFEESTLLAKFTRACAPASTRED